MSSFREFPSWTVETALLSSDPGDPDQTRGQEHSGGIPVCLHQLRSPMARRAVWPRAACKSDGRAARYEIITAEADIVRTVYDHYVIAAMSIGAITRLLNERGVPTRKRISRWERSTVWAMLRNPAYRGTACFGKTETAARQRITRPLRLRGGIGTRDSAHHERPRSEWIEIAVPAIVDEETFVRAQELLARNKKLAPRRTIAHSIVQGLVSCSKCGYALSRTSTRSSARNIHYYRCLGSDAWRRLGGPVCDNRPVRQDLLDHVVWTEVVRLPEDPGLIQSELDRRLTAARTADPAKQREKVLHRELTRTRKSMDRLLTAYQEELLSLDELRRRMPELRQRERALQTELRSILDQISDRAVYRTSRRDPVVLLGPAAHLG